MNLTLVNIGIKNVQLCIFLGINGYKTVSVT